MFLGLPRCLDVPVSHQSHNNCQVEVNAFYVGKPVPFPLGKDNYDVSQFTSYVRKHIVLVRY